MYIAGRKRLANFHATDKKTKRNDIDDESYPLFVQSLFGRERYKFLGDPRIARDSEITVGQMSSDFKRDTKGAV